MALSKLACRSGPGLKLDPDVCLRDLRYDGFCTGLAAEDKLLVQVADAGSLGGGILSYLLTSSLSTGSCTLGSLFFLLNFLRKLAAEKGELGGFSTGLSVGTSLGVTEKLGARGPFGFC